MVRRRDIWVAPFALLAGCRTSTSALAGIHFRQEKKGNSPVHLLHIHGDETTAREVLQQSMPTFDGTAFFVESSTREVLIGSLQIDPNRMFSREGAEASLRKLNPDAEEAKIHSVLDQLDAGRDQFLSVLLPPPGGLLITLHNNSRGYSMEEELAISDRYTFNQPDSPYDFLLASSLPDFDLLDHSPFNCVLQMHPPPPDDGSLSRLCSLRKIRYINIEAALGNTEVQQKMFDWVLKNIPPRRSPES